MNACEDRKLWLTVARRGKVRVIPSVAMEYRIHAGQSKPPNVDEIRQAVWREFIDGLPPREQLEANRIRDAAELVRLSQEARGKGKWLRALRLQLAACLIAPRLVFSPLTGQPIWWGLKKCLARVAEP